MDTQLKQGIKWALITMVISGISVFLNAQMLRGIDPIVHTTIKNSMVGVILLVWLMVTGEGVGMRGLQLKDKVRLLLIGLIGGSVPFILFFTGLKMIGPVEGALIHKSLVVWVALLSIPILKEKPSKKLWLGVAILYAVNVVVGFSGFDQWSLGHVMVLGATWLWAIENVIAKKTLALVSVQVVATARMAIGAVVLIGILWYSGKAPLIMALTGQQWMMLTILSLILLMYVLTWYRALKLAPATVVTALLVGATIITTLLSSIFVSHQLGLVELAQIGLIGSGAGLVIRAYQDRRNATQLQSEASSVA